MNLILLEPREIVCGEAHLTDRRARHIAEVIRPAVGDTLLVGVIGGARGDAEVLSVAPESVRLSVRLTVPPALTIDGDPPRPPRVHLVLAVPRPKVLGRVLQTLGALGVARLDLVNAWRVEKSYFGSPALEPAAIRHALILGAEQGATTWLPPFFVHRRLMAYLEDPPAEPVSRVVAHPKSTTPLESIVTPGPADCLVAVGPEGGWIQREVETFEQRGFVSITLGPAILRTEQVVGVLLGQLALLERLGALGTRSETI
jgi:RsmE family RNA methyltransferase